MKSSIDGDKRKFDGLNVMATTATNKEIFLFFKCHLWFPITKMFFLKSTDWHLYFSLPPNYTPVSLTSAFAVVNLTLWIAALSV